MHTPGMTELVRKARSYRRFDESDRVPESLLRELVDIARLTPCGGNQQPLRYRIVHRKDECEAVFPFIKWAAALPDWPGPAAGQRPTGYIAVLAASSPGTEMGIAGQTMQLAATEAGYGAIMLGAIDRPKIHTALKLPQGLNILVLLAVGRPTETVVLEPAHAGDKLAYYRTPDGVHHVPKLSLEDVLVK